MVTKRTLLSLMLALSLFIFTQNCNSQPKKPSSAIFKITRDTIHVDIEGLMGSAILINNKYYAFYSIRDPNSTLPIKKCYIITKDGKTVKEIKVPEEIHQDIYSYLRFWQGHIIANSDEYKNKSTYFLDENKGEFIKQPGFVQVPIYEDNNYEVTGECHGEFGSTTYFKSKKTGHTYSISSSCPSVINKLGDKYLINTSEIVNIMDTAKMKGISPASDSVISNTINENHFDSDFLISTLFLANGILYQIYNSHANSRQFTPFDYKERLFITKDTIKIGTMSGGKFKPLCVLKDHIDINLQQQLSPDYQVCTFHTEERITVGFKKDVPPYKEAKYGFIEINGNEIKIHYFFSTKDGTR